MSSKSKFKGAKKVSLPKVPRELNVIQAEYGQLAAKCGQVQYQIFVMEQELKQTNEQMLELNREGAARNELDKNKQVEEQPPVSGAV